MSLLPIFLKLDSRPGLLVGAGTVALEKIGSLLKTGVKLRVVAPQARPEVRALAAEGKLEWIQREFQPSDLDGNFIVIAATDVPEVNAAVYREAVARGIACNSVDDIPNCDFFFGSVVSRGDLQIAISTAGESPAVAQRLRREIDEQLAQGSRPLARAARRAAPRSPRHASARRRAPPAPPRARAAPDLRLRPLLHAPVGANGQGSRARRRRPCGSRRRRAGRSRAAHRESSPPHRIRRCHPARRPCSRSNTQLGAAPRSGRKRGQALRHENHHAGRNQRAHDRARSRRPQCGAPQERRSAVVWPRRRRVGRARRSRHCLTRSFPASRLPLLRPRLSAARSPIASGPRTSSSPPAITRSRTIAKRCPRLKPARAWSTCPAATSRCWPPSGWPKAFPPICPAPWFLAPRNPTSRWCTPRSANSAPLHPPPRPASSSPAGPCAGLAKPSRTENAQTLQGACRVTV